MYEAVVDGQPKALKWYFPRTATPAQRGVVTELVAYALRDRRFLWPEAVVLGEGRAGFGYSMPLLPPEYVKLAALFRRAEQARTDLRRLVTACLLLSDAFELLHRDGIAYRDIHYNNVFFRPDTGEVLICDNDNAVFEGTGTQVDGTLETMAPELVRADPGAHPGTLSDLYSLSVLMFMILVNQHPLEGALELAVRVLEPDALNRLYGTDPVFIFDPGDTRNRAVPGEHDTAITLWGLLPGELRTLFTEAFTAGLQHPNRRVREIQWTDALGRCRDGIATCGRCGKQSPTEAGAGDRNTGRCWNCGLRLAPTATLTVQAAGRTLRHLPLDRGTVVYAHHLSADPRPRDYCAVGAEIRVHPRRPGVLGLANLGETGWRIDGPDGTPLDVPPGRSAALRDGLKIDMGAVQATVRMERIAASPGAVRPPVRP